MASAPLLLIVEFEPPLCTAVTVGGSYRSHLQMLDADTRLPADPTDVDGVQLIVTPPFTAPTTYVYGVDPEIVKDGIGLYHSDIPVTIAGKNLSQWIAISSDVGVGSSTMEVEGINQGNWW